MLPSITFDSDKNIIKFGESLVSFHCHHYNCGLLRAIEEIPGIDGHGIITETAAEEFFTAFKKILTHEAKPVPLDKAIEGASDLYRLMGFGRLDFSELTAQGGIAYADSSYYAMSWLAKYGRRDTAVCYFTCGFIAGILGVIFDAGPHTYEVKETRCLMLHHDRCEFVVSKRA
ncbi:MAG: 4-vinyl reductase [Desulfobulbaceae bacterium]|nr:4-vinyl reductase [Desulfobulbaceae bacterium]